jgi:S1-C subfamily serine protease
MSTKRTRRLTGLLAIMIAMAFAAPTGRSLAGNPGARARVQALKAAEKAQPGEEGDEPGGAITPDQLRELILQGMKSEGAMRAGGAGELDLASLKQRYQNAVVKIEFTAIANVTETKFNPTKSETYYSGDEPPHGTGFFINQRDIVTNAHVVEEARQGSIRIKSPATGNVEFKADIIGVAWSESIDLAVLRLPEDEALRFKRRATLKEIPALQFGDSDKVRQADALAIFGYPQSSDELKIIQAKVTGRQYLKTQFDEFVCGHQFLEVGPAGVVQPGNSGGPALNSAGEVVGLPARGSGYGSEQGWLIPSNIVKAFLEQVNASEQGRKEIRIPSLGISLTENFAGTAVWAGAPEDMIIFEVGVVVREVIPNSLADKWGLKSNDIILGYANKQKGISAALDFKGYRVTTGKMAVWPPREDSSAASSPSTTSTASAASTTSTTSTAPAAAASDDEQAKLHVHELVMLSSPGDDVTFWYIRPGVSGIQQIEKKLEFQPPVKLPHLGVFEKPPFELWGDFVAQDFNDYNVRLFDVPPAEILKGGVLVTFTEPNSLASRRGMKINSRSPFGFAFMAGEQIATNWVVVESINGEPVKSLAELRAALRKAEQAFEAKKKEPGYDPAQKALMKERYVQIGFRANTTDGRVLRLRPGFPIDDALECRSVLKPSPAADG